MTNTIMIVPASDRVEVTKISLGLTRAFTNRGYKTEYLQPIQQKSKRNNHQIIEHKDLSQPIDISYAEHLLSHGWSNELLEDVVSMHEHCCKKADLVIVRGLSYLPGHPYANKLNAEIANALNAKVIILAAADQKSRVILEDQILITAHDYSSRNILGCIVNRIEIPADFIPANIKVISYIPYKKRPKLVRKAIINFIAKHFDANWLNEVAKSKPSSCLTSPMFRHQLAQKARAANKTIVLPESSDVRILKAAAICARKKIANCILIGEADEIQQIAAKNAIKLEKITIIEPSEKLVNSYVEPMVNLRKHKGLTIELAKESLQDPVVLATMMLEQGEIDGIVSGAIHTTANTIRPALQLIKTVPNVSLVSSIFFMCLPDQVLVYGDCAVNPNPNSKELAEIAIESADSAALFGIEPKVAMISYSTGSSGHGPDVEKVREATAIVKNKRPDIIIDGPLQYDAAIRESVAKQKAPESPVAGQATVCIFPDLNTGNALYKAVQRSSNILSIGPMMQGLRKPVNDLSRGCLVEDIVFTVALTAIQATHKTTST